jgi:hypothetical protein
MKHSFSQTPTIDAPRSRFNRSFAHKFDMDAGWLVPFYWDEVLPGDTFNLETTIFARLATPLHPILDNAYIDTHFFFVPYRLIWENSKKFFGEQVDPADSIDYSIPVLAGSTASDADGNLTLTTGRCGKLLNYLGIPDGIAPTDITDLSALPTRAYNRIYAEWFRDQNLIDSPDLDTNDTADNVGTGEWVLRRRGKRHDYFTSALPWPQKKDATYGSGVTLPLGTSAPVKGIGKENLNYVSGSQSVYEADGSNPTYTEYQEIDPSTADESFFVDLDSSISGYPHIYADLSNATAATINDLREAFQIQKLLERDARGGTRYSEIVKNHFGVDFYDVSYRPEYLGGGSMPVNISPLAQTAGTSAGSAVGVGDLAAVGTAGGSGHGFNKSFVEHGLVMGFISCRADLTYQQGVRREFRKSTRYDIYWPSLAHLGEQEVLNSEIYAQGTSADDEAFGYQERYAEYRYKPSQISGIFQSAATSSLDAWHLSQEFSTLPTLGETFIQEDPPFDRCIQVSSEPHFIVDTYTSLLCARPIPVFGVPGMIDHF